jgi:hypothetical protein
MVDPYEVFAPPARAKDSSAGAAATKYQGGGRHEDGRCVRLCIPATFCCSLCSSMIEINIGGDASAVAGQLVLF